MSDFAGIAQHRERRSALPEVAGETPAPRSILLRAFTAGLTRDPAAFEAGRADGAAGVWRLPAGAILAGDFQAFSYASGFVEGRRFGPNTRKGG